MDDSGEEKRGYRRMVLMGAGVGLVAVILAIVFAHGLGSRSQLVNTTYANADIKYDLMFYDHSAQSLLNSLSWMTRGGTRSFDKSASLLTSPALGKYGTGVAIYIVPIPGNKQPLLTKGSCSSLPALTEVSSVKMQADGSRAVVCGQKTNRSEQEEYVFQFTQHNLTYDGFIFLPFDWKQVAYNPTTAKAFVAYANLSKYNSAIDTIVSSIQVK